MNILVVEDNADDIVLLEHAFRKSGPASRLNSVSDGLEALDYLQGLGGFADRETHPFPDLLLLDLNMPRMNGFELLQRLRGDSRCSRLMVHVLTASSLQADVERAYELHANSYTVKPSRFDELVGFVTTLHQWHGYVKRPKAATELKM